MVVLHHKRRRNTYIVNVFVCKFMHFSRELLLGIRQYFVSGFHVRLPRLVGPMFAK